VAKGVLLHRTDSIYDDLPAVRYQFPKQYFSRLSKFVGDWIVYYEPVKAGNLGYNAIARIEQIIADPNKEGMFLALIEPGSYLPFEYPVPFSDHTGVIETGLLNEAGKISGRAQSAVRSISILDFNKILDRGIPDTENILPRIDPTQTPENLPIGLNEARREFQFEQHRDRVVTINNRVVRDRVFRKIVLDAYDRRCAITGFSFINGGGRAEVEAAHIKPVEANGPDIISNGLALSGTVHWMFDRGLIGLSDNYDILVSRQVNDPESVWKIINPNRTAFLPRNPAMRPHPAFLGWHREHRFKH
jgi:putative restriction endonuclease